MKLTERKEMAKALNFGKYPVLTYNLDTEEGSKAVALKETRNHGVLRYKCTLYRGKQTREDGIFYLLTHATVMSAHIGVHDYLKDAEYANAPVIETNAEVAILVYSTDMDIAYVEIVQAGKVDPDYSTATTFSEV